MNIRTDEFRRLRSESGQGLGGLAQDAMCPVITFDYFTDKRIVGPTLLETRREGLISAICTPLLVSNDIFGLLYAANRHLTAFTSTDAALIAEFARIATTGVERARADLDREVLVQRAERERLAFELHDTVVQGLIEIGFEASSDNPHATVNQRKQLERISDVAEANLHAIRALLSEMTLSRTHQLV
jgi:GAF domain-containing protein